jgi:hypothetical protein
MIVECRMTQLQRSVIRDLVRGKIRLFFSFRSDPILFQSGTDGNARKKDIAIYQ